VAPVLQLTLVQDPREVAASHRAFVHDLPRSIDLAIDLVRRTRYWVYDPISKTFSPSKFSGYVAMDFLRYDAARKGPSTGAKFDGGVTQHAIAHVLGDYRQDDLLAGELEAWTAVVFGGDVLKAIAPAKWRFVRLPRTGAGGLAGLAGGWEGSDELADDLLALRRSPGRVAPELG
jgi:hypothetical protein